MYMRSSRVRYSAAVPQIRSNGLTPVPISPASRTIRISWHKMSVRGRFSARKYGKLIIIRAHRLVGSNFLCLLSLFWAFSLCESLLRLGKIQILFVFSLDFS